MLRFGAAVRLAAPFLYRRAAAATQSIDPNRWRVLKASSVSYGKATSYLPVIDLLKGYFGIEDRDGLREIEGKVAGGLRRLDRFRDPAGVPLLALLDVPLSDARWQTLDPRQRRRATLDALKQLLLREAHNQPLLLICEDLHWIDGLEAAPPSRRSRFVPTRNSWRASAVGAMAAHTPKEVPAAILGIFPYWLRRTSG